MYDYHLEYFPSSLELQNLFKIKIKDIQGNVVEKEVIVYK